MDRVRVIVAEGARVRGPAVVQLSREQHEVRSGVLGRTYRKGGLFELDGGQELRFKLGEEFGIEGSGRLNRGLFEDLAEAEAARKAAEEAEAKGGEA